MAERDKVPYTYKCRLNWDSSPGLSDSKIQALSNSAKLKGLVIFFQRKKNWQGMSFKSLKVLSGRESRPSQTVIQLVTRLLQT